MPTFPASLPLLEGQNFTLQCYGNGIPSPTLEWVKTDKSEDHLIQPRAVIPDNLVFESSVEKIVSEPGIYKCQANNEYNETAQGIEIISVHPTSMSEFLVFKEFVMDIGSISLSTLSLYVYYNV